MTKVIFADRIPKRTKGTLKIPRRKFRTSHGDIATMPILDAQDPDFGLKMEAVFQENVVKAIKAAKKLSKTRRAAGKK